MCNHLTLELVLYINANYLSVSVTDVRTQGKGLLNEEREGKFQIFISGSDCVGELSDIRPY